jgi:hypothetical protein
MGCVAELAVLNLATGHGDEQVFLPLDHLYAVNDEYVIKNDRTERFQVPLVAHRSNLYLGYLHPK